MRFAIASEGRTDFIILKNLLIGFFNDKGLFVTPLRPKEKEPFGWSNLLNYISSEQFKEDCDDDNIDYVVIQIDTDKCEEWGAKVTHVGTSEEKLEQFFQDITEILIAKIGDEYYSAFVDKIIFAISVHEMECWLLPFNTTQKAHVKKMVGCFNTLESIASSKGFSLHQKNYQEGKNYHELSKEMMNIKVLMKKYSANPSLKKFVELLLAIFPRTQSTPASN